MTKNEDEIPTEYGGYTNNGDHGREKKLKIGLLTQRP